MADGAANRESGATHSDGGDGGALKRVISGKLLLLFILGDMIGGGVYVLVGEVSLETGGAVWTAFLAAFVLALLTAGSYAELVTKYPRAAGAALYVHKAFKIQFVTFIVAFLVMSSGITSAAALAKAFAGDYFSEFLEAPQLLVSLLFLGALFLINMRGISESVKTNAVFTIIEVAGLLLIIVIGVFALGGGSADVGRTLEFKQGATPIGAIIAGVTIAFYALIGFEDAVNVAEETEDPSRVFPRALFGAMLLAGVIYLAVTLISVMVVDLKTLGGSDAPLLEVVKAGPLDIPPLFFSGIALFAVANGALINMIMASRIVYGMATQGIVPTVFARVLPGRRTPWVAIVFTTALCAALIITGDLGVLADTTVMLLLIVFTIVNISVLVLRRDPVDHDHFTTPTFAPVLGAAVSLFLVTQNEAEIYLRAGIIVVIALVFWVINAASPGERREMDAEAFSG